MVQGKVKGPKSKGKKGPKVNGHRAISLMRKGPKGSAFPGVRPFLEFGLFPGVWPKLEFGLSIHSGYGTEKRPNSISLTPEAELHRPNFRGRTPVAELPKRPKSRKCRTPEKAELRRSQ